MNSRRGHVQVLRLSGTRDGFNTVQHMGHQETWIKA